MTTSLNWKRDGLSYKHGDYEARACAGGYRLFSRGSFVFGAPTLRQVETHLIGRLKERAQRAAEITRLANDEPGLGHEKDMRPEREAKAREQGE